MKAVLSLLFCLLAFRLIKAEDPDRGFTFNLGETAQKQTLPSWMNGDPSASPSAHATISFPITPPAGDSDLAVTFYFTETDGGFLRVWWAGTRANEMLSENLYEGIAMPNQRTLLIKRATLSTPGTLNVQSSEATLNISRIHWEWVDPAPVSLADAVKQSALINAAGSVLAGEEVSGDPLLPKADEIGKSVVTAHLTDKPERIEAGVEFVATLQAVPQYARLEVRMAGVPILKPVQLWINNAPAGEVSMEIPNLNDPGYQAVQGAPPVYIGWRKGVVWLPAGQLNAGDNQFEFAVKDTTAATPLAVKDLLLQLKYEDQTADAPVVTPPASPTTPAGPPPAQTSGSQGLIFYRFNGTTDLR